MYLCVCPCMCVSVCEEYVYEKRVKRKEGEKIKEEKRRKKLIHTDKQADRQIERHKSFIDMRYNTE